MSELDNLRQWDATKRGVYEVWYLTWNHPETGQGFWLRFVIETPIDHPARAELWFARFDPKHPDKTFGFHRRFPIAALAAKRDPFELAIGDGRLGHDHSFGDVAGAGHTVRWDLRWDPSPHVLRLFPDVMYVRGGLGETTVQSPNPRVPMSGRLVVDGEELVFDRAVLGQTHLWGKKHAYSWTWCRCAEFTGAPGAVLEILGVRIKRRGAVLPPLVMVVLELDGERHLLNQFRHVAMNRATWGGQHVSFAARSAFVKIDGELSCTPDQMVIAPYLDPDGTEVFCANTEIGDAQVTVSKRNGLGWREVRRLDGRGRAHFEIGGRERDPAVKRRHITVE